MSIQSEAKSSLLHVFPTKTVLVVGDLMLDKYIWGTCKRISPEAPVPVVHVKSKSCALGGAANVALNIAQLGAKAALAGVVGEDADGSALKELCQASSIEASAIVSGLHASTTSKTRLMAETHQLARIDEEVNAPKVDAESDQLLASIEARLNLGDVSAIILSDYAKGVCTPYFCQKLFALGRAFQIPVYVDPKGKDYEKYRGATAIKPNRSEIQEISEVMSWPTHDSTEAARLLREHLDLDFVAVTLGANGIVVVERETIHEMPTVAREVFDVSGAGDTVISTMVCGLASGLNVVQAVTLANFAAGHVVSKVGTTAISRQDLLLAIQSNSYSAGLKKLYDLDEIQALIASWKAQGQTIAFTNGCFDLLHAGHVSVLEHSAAFADRLVVGINSDSSVRRLKGPNRPLMNEDQRARVLSALESIDAVVVFGEDTPLRIIEAIRPDVLVKGGDYSKENIVGSDFVESYGGQVQLVPLVKGISTSYLASEIEKL